MALCPKHLAESSAWLDYRVVRPIRIASSAAYDDTAAGLRDRTRRNTEEWRDTIRQQQALIRDACARGAHCAETTEEHHDRRDREAPTRRGGSDPLDEPLGLRP